MISFLNSRVCEFVCLCICSYAPVKKSSFSNGFFLHVFIASLRDFLYVSDCMPGRVLTRVKILK